MERLARAQAGLVARSQVMAAGYKAKEWAGLIRAGRLMPARRGLYELFATRDWYERELHAALLLAGEGSVLSGRSAALLHRLWGQDRAATPLELIIPRKRKIAVPGLNVTRMDLAEADVQVLRHLRVTTPVRTLVDLAAVLEWEGLALAFESARRYPRFLEDLSERLKQAEPYGAEALRELLRDARARPRPFDSAWEVMIWRRLKQSGLPRPVPQYAIKTARQTFYADFAWPTQKVALELEGYETHGLQTAFQRDRRRTSAIASEGYLYFPLTFERYLTDFAGYLAEVREAVLRRTTGRGRSAA